MTVHMTIELNEADDAQLRAIAEHEELSPEDLVKKLLAERLEYDRSYRDAVQRGMDDFAAGRFFTHEEVVARSEKRRAELLARSKA